MTFNSACPAFLFVSRYHIIKKLPIRLRKGMTLNHVAFPRITATHVKSAQTEGAKNLGAPIHISYNNMIDTLSIMLG
jgi:hypothetical protein